MNLSHQEQGELPLHGGFPPAPLLTGLMNLPFPSTPDANPEVLTKRTTALFFRDVGDALWDISLMRDVTQLKLTGCRCDSSFCCVDKVNRIQRGFFGVFFFTSEY